MKSEAFTENLIDLAGALLDEGRSLTFRMQGNSMYPIFKAGDIGMVEKCLPEELIVGDIVVFRENNKLIAHRLIRIIHQNNIRIFIARGDKNYHTDAPFTADALIGKITTFKRRNSFKKPDSLYTQTLLFFSRHYPKLVIPYYDAKLRVKSYVSRIDSTLQSVRHNFSIISKHSRKELTVNLVISILQGISPFAIIYCIKLLIDELTTPSVQGGVNIYFSVLLIITAFVFLINALLSVLNGYFLEKLSQSVTRHVSEMLHSKHTGLEMSHYENPAEQDKIHRAVQQAGYRPVKMLTELLTWIRSFSSTLVMLALFITIRWYLVLLLLLIVIPGVLVRLKATRKLYKLKESQSALEREMYYYNRVLTGFPFAKELKLFGFSSFFLRRFTKAQNQLFEQKIAFRKSELRHEILAQLFAVVLIFFMLGYVSFLRLNGEITIGTVALFFFVFQRGYSVMNDLFKSLTLIVEDNTYLNDFIDFLKLPQAQNEGMQRLAPLKKSIKVENVSFHYESSSRDALKSVNLTIPAGKTVAFVGANGSGKTTMIKLLCGFYRPDSGRILFDGMDATMIGQKNICEQVTAVFQDFALYNIPAVENLTLGNVQIDIDREKARKAAQAAGIADVIEGLPNGYDTLLGKLFKGGEELSIGQWQKIAVARAFYRDSPILLMDEPSSALDAESESQMLQNLKKLSRDKTVVIISHRLSSVRWADIIHFFDEGEVVESGTHQELMELQGKYYSLYQTSNNRGEMG